MVAAIVPALNEGKTIGDVVRELKKAKLVDEVIVVSDGSTDNTVEVAKKAGADNVRIHKTPQGKGQAMQKGIQATDAKIILFIDADLKGFTAEHADMLIKPVKDKKAHMCVGLRDRSWLYKKTARWLPLISGERALRREVFARLKPSLKKGFLIEVAMNRYCKKYKLPITTRIMNGVGIVKKYQKVGWAKGILGYIKMDLQLLWAYIMVRFKV